MKGSPAKIGKLSSYQGLNLGFSRLFGSNPYQDLTADRLARKHSVLMGFLWELTPKLKKQIQKSSFKNVVYGNNFTKAW